MSTNIKPGDRVIIEICPKEIFHGTVVHFIHGESIELCDIYCQNTQTEHESNMTFYRNEVTSVRIISNNNKNIESKPSMPISNGHSFNESNKIKMLPDEFEKLKEMTLQFNFIDIFDTKCKNAIDLLSERESIGVIGLGNTFNRNKPLSLLVICDFDQVYIFDMFCLRQMKDLKDIFECESITKVVYDGVALFDCLFHKYSIEMKNIFDIQVVDTMMLTKEDESVAIPKNISECLAHHFNFPLSLLAAAMDDMHDKTWLERPVIKSNKIKAAQLAVYLLPLRDHLMKKILREYNDAIQGKYNKYKQMTDTELLAQMRNLTLVNGH